MTEINNQDLCRAYFEQSERIVSLEQDLEAVQRALVLAETESERWKNLAALKDAKGEANRTENNNLRQKLQAALSELEKIRTERVAVRGLPKEASAVSAARVLLQQ